MQVIHGKTDILGRYSLLLSPVGERRLDTSNSPMETQFTDPGKIIISNRASPPFI